MPHSHFWEVALGFSPPCQDELNLLAPGLPRCNLTNDESGVMQRTPAMILSAAPFEKKNRPSDSEPLSSFRKDVLVLSVADDQNPLTLARARRTQIHRSSDRR